MVHHLTGTMGPRPRAADGRGGFLGLWGSGEQGAGGTEGAHAPQPWLAVRGRRVEGLSDSAAVASASSSCPSAVQLRHSAQGDGAAPSTGSPWVGDTAHPRAVTRSPQTAPSPTDRVPSPLQRSWGPGSAMWVPRPGALARTPGRARPRPCSTGQPSSWVSAAVGQGRRVTPFSPWHVLSVCPQNSRVVPQSRPRRWAQRGHRQQPVPPCSRRRTGAAMGSSPALCPCPPMWPGARCHL